MVLALDRFKDFHGRRWLFHVRAREREVQEVARLPADQGKKEPHPSRPCLAVAVFPYLGVDELAAEEAGRDVRYFSALPFPREKRTRAEYSVTTKEKSSIFSTMASTTSSGESFSLSER